MPSSGVQTCARSEEHTSELQSHDNLVCRLLLEKTKNVLNQLRGAPPPGTPALSHPRAPRVRPGTLVQGLGAGDRSDGSGVSVSFFYYRRPPRRVSLFSLPRAFAA